jgi:hypothetical protein
MASILKPSKVNFFPEMMKIIGTLGPMNCRRVTAEKNTRKIERKH